MTRVKPEPEFHYVWATPLRPHEFLATCTPYNKSGGFRAPVEVVIFPATASPGYEVLSSREYLEKGADLDEGAAAVRFNADTVEPFSVIWAPERPLEDGEAVGRIHAIGPKSVATMIMREMIEKSSTPRASRRVDAVLAEGERLNGRNSPLSPRPTLADAGLVKSVSVPPGRLRMLSRLDGEILSPGQTLRHELLIGTTVPGAQDEAVDLVCEIAVFPKGWVKLEADSGRRLDDLNVKVLSDWHPPYDGRTGSGSRYVFEDEIAHSGVHLVSTPPASRRPPSGRRAAEVLTKLTRAGEELCRLHHPFWIEMSEPAFSSQAISGAFAEALQEIRDLALLSEEDIARVTGAEVDAVRAWLLEASDPSGEQADRITELSAVVERLAHVIDPDFIVLWLRKPLLALDDEKPLDVLARGEYRRIGRVIAAIEAPVAS